MIARVTAPLTRILDRFASSAVLLREAARTSRRWQTYAARVAFSGALFGVLLAGIWAAVNAPFVDPAEMAWMGNAIFIAFSSALMVLAIALAPLMTSAALIEETEDRTLEMLVLSKLEPTQILVGKVLSRILILLTIVLGALPVLATVVTLGGVAPQAVVGVTVHALVAVVLMGSVGAFFGLFTRSPLLAMLASACFTVPTFWLLPIGYVASTGHPNDAVHFSLFAGPAAQDWTSPIAALTWLPTVIMTFIIGSRLFELRIANADIRKAFASETWGVKTWLYGLAACLVSGLLLPLPILGAYTFRFGGSGWLFTLGTVGCVAVIWLWWTVALTLLSWTLLRIGVDVVDAFDGLMSGRGRRARDRSDVRVWSNPVAWREARPTAWRTNGGALLASWLLAMLGILQTGYWLIPGGALSLGWLNTLTALGLTAWLAARSVEEERKNRSLEILLTTHLASPRILFGKMLGVAIPTLPLLLLSMPLLTFGLPHLHMFDLFDNQVHPVGFLGWLVRGFLGWVWTLPLWGVVMNGSLLIALRVKRQRGGFAIAAGMFAAAVLIPGGVGRIFENVWWIAGPCRMLSPAIAGGASPWQYVFAIALWTVVALGLAGWTSFGLRRWIGAAIALTLGVGIATTAVPAHAQQVPVQDGFQILAAPLGDGIVRADHWAAVRIRTVNRGPDAVATLSIVERAGTTSLAFERRVGLPSGGRKDVVLMFRPNSSTRPRQVMLTTQDGRRASVEFPLRPLGPTEVAIGVMGIDQLGIQSIRQVASSTAAPGRRPSEPGIAERSVRVGLIEPGVLSAHSAGYAPFDQLVWPGADPSQLEPSEQTALVDYVADGGHLTLTVTENWRALSQSALADLLPVRFSGTGSLQPGASLAPLGIDALSTPVPFARATLRPRAGRHTFTRMSSDTGEPLWVTGTYGLGTISVLALDPRAAAIRTVTQPETLWRTLLSMPDNPNGRLVVDSALFGVRTPNNRDLDRDLDLALHRTFIAGGTGLSDSPVLIPISYNESSEQAAGTVVREWLSDVPGVAPLPLSWLLGFSLVYLLLIGPIDYAVLRVLKRQPWTWVTFPVSIAVFSSAALIGTSLTKGDQSIASRVELVDLLPGTDRWRGDTYVGVFATAQARISVRSKADDSVTEPLDTSGYTPSTTLTAGLGPGEFSWSSGTWTMGYGRSRWTERAPGSVTLESGPGGLVLRNDLPFPLRGVHVYELDTPTIGNGQPLDDIPSGGTVPLDLDRMEAAPVQTGANPLFNLALDPPSDERGYLDTRAYDLMLIAEIDPVQLLDIRGVNATERATTYLRVPLTLPEASP